MFRCCLTLALTILALGPLLIGAQEPAPTFRSSADAIQMSVTVTDPSGRPVSGLTRDDFEIFEPAL